MIETVDNAFPGATPASFVPQRPTPTVAATPRLHEKHISLRNLALIGILALVAWTPVVGLVAILR